MLKAYNATASINNVSLDIANQTLQERPGQLERPAGLRLNVKKQQD